VIADIRGKGLLIMVEFQSEDIATNVKNECLARGLFVNQIQGNGIRIFPALNIKKDELDKGLRIIEDVTKTINLTL
jgi:acetylornithine/N-succinyldiaminopimelate aminotransferase